MKYNYYSAELLRLYVSTLKDVIVPPFFSTISKEISLSL